MSFQGQPGAEGSLSESVHFPPTSSYFDYQGGYHVDGRMAPPLSSASRAPARLPVLPDDGRGGVPGHYGGYDRSEFEYALRRHSCGDHIGLHSGTLIEQLLLQENQKALRIASMVQSQASGCLSGCLSCGNRPRFRDSEERILDEQRSYSRNVAGEGPSRSANLEGNAVDGYPDGWLRQPNPRQSIGERSQGRISFSENELGRSLCQGRRILYPVGHPNVSHSQASHHVQDHHLHPAGAAESSVPILGFTDGDDRVRQKWPAQRQSYSDIGTEEDGWQRSSRSGVERASGREQGRLSLPGVATGSLPRAVVGGPPRPAGDSVRHPQITRTSSQSLVVMPENSADRSYQDNALEQTGVQRLVTQGPISLTNWYIMKVQIGEVDRAMETKVAIGGWLSPNQEHVRTSPIVNRLDIHKVVTEDGVEVFLDGTMDQETSNANGFAPGIVQCLSAGFPYMWKQMLRVRSVGESSSLAVSESLGGLHPRASKCLSEDESQGVDDPKISKRVAEDVACSSRECEGTSPTPAVNEDWLSIQNPVDIASDVVETAATVTSGAEKSSVETQDPVTAGADVSLVETQDAAITRVETSHGVTQDAVNARVGISHAVTQDAVTARAGISHVETPEAVIVRAEKSDAVDTEAEAVAAAPVRAETLDIVVTDAAITARADASCVLETEATIPVGTLSSDAIDDCRPQHEVLQQSHEYVNLASLDPAPGTEEPLQHVTHDVQANGTEHGPFVETTCVTIRKSRKSKREASRPVRSSRRLQQRQSRSSESTPNLVDSLPPSEMEQVASGMIVTLCTSSEEPAEVVPNVEHTPTGREELTRTNSIIEEVLMDLQQVNTEAGDQDPLETSVDTQLMEAEPVGQTQGHCEFPSIDRAGFELQKSTELKKVSEDVVAGVEIEATVSLGAFADLESEKMEETTLVTPSNVEIEQTVPVAPLDLEREESAPATPPELLQSKVQPRVDSLRNVSSRQERVLPVMSVRVTRSLKRRLVMSPTGDADGLPVTGSLKRLRRLSEPVFNPDTSPPEELATVEAFANPETPLNQEVNAFHVRVRGSESARTVNCANCKQPCLPQNRRKVIRYVASSDVIPEQVLKEEKVDYAPLSPHHTAGAHDDRTESYSVKLRSDRFKNMKPATRFANTAAPRRLIVGDSSTEPKKGKELSECKRPPRKAIVFYRGSRARKGKGSRRGKESRGGEGSSKRSSKGQVSRQVEGSSKGKVSSEVEESREVKRLRDCSGSRVKKESSEGFGLELSLGKSRRASILPPPLPPPRVQDKSKVPEAFGLKISRSGRLLVPPLAFWRSQSIEYDKDGGIIAICDGFQANPADTGCYNFTPPQEKHAKRIQEKLCKAATAVSGFKRK